MIALFLIVAVLVILHASAAVISVMACAWLVSPSSPCQPVAAWWRPLIVLTMKPVPGQVSYA